MIKKTTAVIMITMALLFTLVPAPCHAATSLEDKAVYYTPASDYRSGDCILTASKFMIRRAMIMNNLGDWSKVTNKKLRGPATIWGLLWNSFKYDAEGLVVSVDSGLFKGKTNATRIKEFEHLLKLHPEGIVVHGRNAAYTGTHGILVVKVENGVVYAADSTRNTGIYNKGIQKWKNTTMLDPKKVSKYWYISGISMSSKTKPSNVKNYTPASTLSIKSVRAPGSIRQGRPYSIRGVISSNNNISSVTVRVRKITGKTVLSSSRTPKAKTFNIIDIDEDIRFGTLKKGRYTYQVIASDGKRTLTLVNKQFKVK